MYEQPTLFDRLEKGRPADVREIQCRIPQPKEDGRPVEASDSQHGAVVANSAQPTTAHESKTEKGGSEDNHVGGVCQAGGRTVESSIEAAASRNVEILGAPACHASEALRQEKSSEPFIRRYRIAEFSRLLNSTPLGPVIDDRQLYRHRMRAGDRFCVERRIDLAAYVTWLIEERHQRQHEYQQPTESIAYENIMLLVKNQNQRCALTGRHLVADSAALDHILPISRGGEHKIENAQVLHKEVNRAKGTMTNEEFIAMCREVVRWTGSHKGRAVDSQ